MHSHSQRRVPARVLYCLPGLAWRLSGVSLPHPPGCRSKEKDFLYLPQLESALKAGSLTRLLTALSRQPGVQKAYVQVGASGAP